MAKQTRAKTPGQGVRRGRQQRVSMGRPIELPPFGPHLKSLPPCSMQPIYQTLRAGGTPAGPDTVSTLVAALQFPELLRRAETVLTSRGGRLVLDTEDAIGAGILGADVCLLQRDIAAVNALMDQGVVSLGAGVIVRGLSAIFEDVDIIDVTINGERYLLRRELKWYGTRYYLSKALVTKLSQLLAVGAGVAGVLAALQAAGIITAPSAAASAVVAAILALGAAALSFLDFCNGVYVVFPHVGFGPISGAITIPA
jgi:hypothetical protein